MRKNTEVCQRAWLDLSLEELLENAKASDVFGATWLTSVKDMKISGLNIPKHL